MVYRKEEYNESGYDVVIQQVNEGGGVSAWIDTYAAHESHAIDHALKHNEVNSQQAEKLKNGDEWEAVKTIVSFMTENDVYFCKNCSRFYDSDNVVGKNYAGHKCRECAKEAATCPDNPDGDEHEDECLNPQHRHNARMPTKYKCVHCGRKRQTTPTG